MEGSLFEQKETEAFRPADKVSRLTYLRKKNVPTFFEKPLKKAEKAADKLEKSHEKNP